MPAHLPKDQLSGGTYYLLSDRQVRVAGSSREVFGRYARQIVNDAGLEGSSQISLEFEPSYQSLTFHWVRVRRGDQWLNRLVPAKIEVIQRETELESQIYDGRLSAVLFLEDLRVGDILDFAYTLTGANPVLGGRYLDSFSVDWSAPVHHMRFRLLWPSNRKLSVRNHATNLAPTGRERGATSELVWERKDAAPLKGESSLPPGAGPWGFVELSEFESWSQVVDWGLRLFEAGSDLPQDLEAKVEEWRRDAKGQAEQTVRALRFVQDEVRYLGFEMGTSSHRPAPPAIVFRRRFGDCKDKSLLLCTLLRRLGLAAHPVLIHTSEGPALPEGLPSPLAFNHAVVAADLGGTRYWLDPTISGQGGRLGSIPFPPYGNALVLEPGSDGLSALPVVPPANPSVVAHEIFTAKDFDAPVELRVETRYEGADADGVRRDHQHRSRDDVASSYLKFYAQNYPKIRSLGSVESEDDREANVLLVRERYSIPGFWSRDEKARKRPTAEVFPSALQGAVPGPISPLRRMPLAQSHPTRVRHVTEVVLPEDWALPGEAEKLEDDRIRFRFKSTYADRRLKLEYDYETLSDTVPAAELGAHRAVVERIRDRLGYSLAPPKPGASGGFNWPVIAAVGCFVPLALVGAFGLARPRPSRGRVARIRDPALRGLRGWLIGLGLLLAVLPVVFGYDLYAGSHRYALAAWLASTSPGSETYHVLWAPYLLTLLLSRLALLMGSVLLLVLFLLRRASFPRVFVLFLALRAFLLFATSVLSLFLPETHGGALGAAWIALGALGPSCAFVPYLFLSDRAQSTFVS